MSVFQFGVAGHGFNDGVFDATQIVGSDTGTGVDDATTTATSPGSDTAAGTEGETTSVSFATDDTAVGTESQVITPSTGDTASSVEGQTVTKGGSEPAFSEMKYDMGWKDVVNSLSLSVTVRQPSAVPVEVIKSEDFFSLAPGETRSYTLTSSDPFYDAITPVLNTDYILAPGSGTVTVTLNRTSGAALTINFLASTNPATVQGFVVRGTLVSVTNTYKVIAKDVDSIAAYGEKTVSLDLPWAGFNDVQAIAELIIGARSLRRPLISVTLNNETDERLTAILQKTISDQIHLLEPTTFTDEEFYIDTITHSITQGGILHKTTFLCEQQVRQVDGVFTFDDADFGFDDGVFGITGIDQEDTVFRLDSSKLNERLLGH